MLGKYFNVILSIIALLLLIPLIVFFVAVPVSFLWCYRSFNKKPATQMRIRDCYRDLNKKVFNPISFSLAVIFFGFCDLFCSLIGYFRKLDRFIFNPYCFAILIMFVLFMFFEEVF